MRYHIFERIQSPSDPANDNLAKLFNAYFEGLSTLEIMSLPYDSMAEYQRCWQVDPSDPHYPADQVKRFFDLHVLSNSLHGIHRSVTKALALLDTFFTDYHGDLLHYATTNRMQSIEEYGSEDPTDWDENDDIVFKSDAESLQHYSLHYELSQFFGHSGTRGEYIGSSGPEDFADFTLMVVNKTSFSIFKFFRNQGHSITVSRLDESGALQPMTLADEVESEINEDIHNGTTAQLFDALLSMGKDTRTYFDALAPTTEQVSQYQLLREVLCRMRDVEVN